MATNITVTVPSQPQIVQVAIPGAQGPIGPNGPTGGPGPANSLTIGTVSSGGTAAASLTGVAPNQTLNLTLPSGPTGSPGQPATLTMGTVTTLNAGDNVTATLTGTAPNYILNLGIPRGPAGAATGTVTVANITDASTTGRTLLQSGDAAAARTAIGAGTSSLALGTTAATAAAGNHTHTAAAVGAIPAFADPNADRLVFWDDSAGSFQPLTLGTGLTISGTTITADAQSPSLANMPAGMTITVLKSAGTWPARPTSRSDIIVAWKGADPSPAIVASGTGGMLDNVDYRLVTP